ncbi:hypothetical protein QJS10_CPB22g01176 [Acorus calamus]|uniref:Tetratricopeptide repeat protein 38 n=1 Tax=Acorus calamus TaxID=4465 RepID=A0AAV9C1M8_ACOCL|nr:hypothetical protein QJS10_CPB22g01176 [Acorus calamus]
METGGEVKRDMWGYAVVTSSDSCISAIDSYYHQVLSYGRNRAVILEGPLHDPDCVLANILAAYFLFHSDRSKSLSHLASASARLDHASSYEALVFEAVSSLLVDDRDDDVAIDLHFKLLKGYPKDLVSLKRAQLLCFYLGRPDVSLNLVEQVLGENQQESYIYGMLAFPLLELGRMADAERAANKGFDINKDDFWSQHALCHIFQYDCRFKEAVDFMEACSSSWNSCSSFMYTHNWWHVAVCYLEGHSPLQKVLEVYDNHIWKELQRSDADCEEVYLNALGLLLRVYVRGQIEQVGDRLKVLATILADQSNWHIEWLLDLLALWALSSTRQTKKAEDLLKAMKSRTYLMGRKKQQSMQRAILLAEALYEYGRGNYERAFECLGPDFDANDCKMIGASDEQLDIFNEVWFSVLLNTGHVSKAIEVIEKRVNKREGIPFLWSLLEKAYATEGRVEASVAGEKAKALEIAYF